MLNLLKIPHTLVTFPDHKGIVREGFVTTYRDRGALDRDTVVVEVIIDHARTMFHCRPHGILTAVRPVDVDALVSI